MNTHSEILKKKLQQLKNLNLKDCMNENKNRKKVPFTHILLI
jgi:hypothetical protein